MKEAIGSIFTAQNQNGIRTVRSIRDIDPDIVKLKTILGDPDLLGDSTELHTNKFWVYAYFLVTHIVPEVTSSQTFLADSKHTDLFQVQTIFSLQLSALLLSSF